MSKAARTLRVATESIAGRREANEDATLADTLPDGRVLLAVADGMGGHAAGEVASALALETLLESVQEGSDLVEAIDLANQRVFEMAREPGKQGMGTTMVAVHVEGEGFQVANVGDSRCYLLSNGGIRQLTEDHSFVAEAVRRGQSVEEAMNSRWREALTRSVGTGPSVEVDSFGPFPVRAGDTLLLCSDGLYKSLPDPDLLAIFLKSRGLQEAVRALAAAAYERGSDDNISLVVAAWEEGSPRRDRGLRSAALGPPEREPRRRTHRQRSEAHPARDELGRQESPGWRTAKSAAGISLVVALILLAFYLLFGP